MSSLRKLLVTSKGRNVTEIVLNIIHYLVSARSRIIHYLAKCKSDKPEETFATMIDVEDLRTFQVSFREKDKINLTN